MERKRRPSSSLIPRSRRPASFSLRTSPSARSDRLDSYERTERTSDLCDERRERLSALCRQGGEKRTHEVRGRRGHPLVDGIHPERPGRPPEKKDGLQDFLCRSSSTESVAEPDHGRDMRRPP